jgi:predicted PurR-regulated permease PerM
MPNKVDQRDHRQKSMMDTEERPSNNEEVKATSPRWNWTTKLVFGLALVALAIWLLVQFQNFLGPVIMALVLAYLFYPVANFIRKSIKIPWRLAVTLLYIVVVLAILGLLTWGGLALVDQVQNLITFIQNNIDQIPQLIKDITQQTYTIGPWEFTLSGLDWTQISSEIVSTVRPVVGQIGSIAGSVATGAANIVFWIGLVLLISYFLLAETEGVPNRFLNIRIPGYTADLHRIGQELSNIWNAFIRGQLIVVLITVIVYTTYLGSMGIQFFFGLAILAAFGRFVPYVGAWVTWITYGLVALLQGTTIFNLPSGLYAIILLGGAMLIDTLLDNLLVPKVMSENLKVHPALVLVGALIALNLLGIVGILLAAPVMATLKLLLGYLLKKLSDQDPWEEFDTAEPKEKARWIQFIETQWGRFIEWIPKFSAKVWQWLKKLFQAVGSKIKSWFKKKHPEE